MKEQKEQSQQKDRGFAAMDDEANRLNNTGSTSQNMDTSSDSGAFRNDKGMGSGSGSEKGR